VSKRKVIRLTDRNLSRIKTIRSAEFSGFLVFLK